MQESKFALSFAGISYPSEYIKNRARTLEVLESFKSMTDIFGLDFETCAKEKYKHVENAAISPHLADIRLIQVFDGNNCYVFDLREIEDIEIFREFFETKRLLAHNGIFELSFLMSRDINNINIGCTAIISRLVIHATHAEDTRIGASLEDMISAVFGENIGKKMQTTNWGADELTFEQIEYAGLDAILTFKLGKELSKTLVIKGLEKIYQLTKEAQHPIASMQLNGLKINVERHKEIVELWKNKLISAVDTVKSLTGLDSITGHKVGTWLEKNLPPEILPLWPKTATGKMQTDSHVFADFSNFPIVEPFSNYQKWSKLTSSFGRPLLDFINPETKKIHASYWLGGARTGRLSSSKPNLQQLPSKEGYFREVFVPAQDSIFICADFSQIEIRVAAELSRDCEMLRAYKEGIDIHNLTASKVTGKNLSDLTKMDRSLAKAFNFGLMFGLGVKGFSHYARKLYGIDISQEAAEKAIQIFRDTYSGYREWQLNQANECGMSLKVRTPCRKLRKLNTDNCYGGSMNTPIQGGAAEIMLYALVILYKYIKNFEGKIVNCVHDEILVECPVKYADFAETTMKNAMTEAFLKVFPNGITRDLVSVGKGYTWAEAKE